MGGGVGMLGVLQSRGLYDDGTSDLAEGFRHSAMLRGASPMMRSEADELLANQQTQSVGDITRSVLPEIMQRQRLLDEQASLSKALGNPTTVAKLGPFADDAREALERLTTSLATFKTGAERILEESQFSVASTLARTATERAAVDYQKNYTEALDRTHSALEASITAEAKRSEAIAESTRTALDALRSTSDHAALVGLSPYDRMMRENDQRFRDMTARTLGGPLPAMALGGGFDSAVTRTIGFEGGLNPRDTNGTPSMYGINAAANPGVDVAGLTPSSAAAIYKKNYWDAIGADSLSPQMARVAFDTAVMEGVGQAMKLITVSHGDAGRLLDLRQEFEGGLLDKNPAKYGPYAKAWANRDAGLRSDIGGSIALPSGASAVTAPDGGAATLANRLNYAMGRQADVSSLLFQGPQASAQQIAAQTAAFKAQQVVVGQSAAAIAAAAERQSEWNQAAASGVTEQKLVNDFGAAGISMWSDLTARINDNATAVGHLAAMRDDLSKTVAVLDEFRGGFGDGLHTFIDDLMKGKSAGTAFRDVLEGLGQKMLSLGESMLTDSLFGKQGSSGGGLLGGLLGSVLHMSGSGDSKSSGFQGWMPKFADGTNDAPGGLSLVGERGPEIVNLPAHAQVIPNGKGFGGPVNHTINMGDTNIVVQGNADDKVLIQMRQEIATTKAETLQEVQRNLHSVSANNQQYS